MDKQSRTISVKVNGTEAKYEEKKKDEFDWMVVESERPKKRCSVSKIESSVYGKKSKEVEQYVNCNRCNCNYYWYGVWDGDATVTERTRCDRRKRSNSFEADAKGRIKGGWNGRTNTSTKKRKKQKHRQERH